MFERGEVEDDYDVDEEGEEGGSEVSEKPGITESIANGSVWVYREANIAVDMGSERVVVRVEREGVGEGDES